MYFVLRNIGYNSRWQWYQTCIRYAMFSHTSCTYLLDNVTNYEVGMYCVWFAPLFHLFCFSHQFCFISTLFLMYQIFFFSVADSSLHCSNCLTNQKCYLIRRDERHCSWNLKLSSYETWTYVLGGWPIFIAWRS